MGQLQFTEERFSPPRQIISKTIMKLLKWTTVRKTLGKKEQIKGGFKVVAKKLCPISTQAWQRGNGAAVRSFPGFCLPCAREQDTCGTHQVWQKNTAANSWSYKKGEIIRFVCSLKGFAILRAALITYVLAKRHKKKAKSSQVYANVQNLQTLRTQEGQLQPKKIK